MSIKWEGLNNVHSIPLRCVGPRMMCYKYPGKDIVPVKTILVGFFSRSCLRLPPEGVPPETRRCRPTSPRTPRGCSCCFLRGFLWMNAARMNDFGRSAAAQLEALVVPRVESLQQMKKQRRRRCNSPDRSVIKGTAIGPQTHNPAGCRGHTSHDSSLYTGMLVHEFSDLTVPRS